MNDYGKKILWTKGKTLYQVQREVGHEIEIELVINLLETGLLSADWQEKLIEDPTRLPAFIKEKIEKNYNSGKLPSEHEHPMHMDA